MMPKSINIHFSDEQSVAPAEDVLTTAEAKAHLRVTTSDEDTIIDAYRDAATEVVQVFTGRQLVRATRILKLERWPDHVFTMPRAPLAGITSIQYVDENGDTKAWGSSNYQVDTTSVPGRVAVAYDVLWPNLRGGDLLPVTVTYTCGFADAASVPEELKTAVRIMTEHFYSNREVIKTGTITTKIPLAVDALITPFKVEWFG